MSTDTLPEHQPDTPTARSDDREMTLLEHLQELRQRLIKSGIALIVGLVIAGAVPLPSAACPSLTQLPCTPTWAVINAVTAPVPGIQAIRPGETLFTYFHVAILAGAALAMPVIAFQVMAFVMPGLRANERKLLFMALPGVIFSFVAGITFGYLALLPFAIRFLQGFGAEIIPPQWSFSEYVGTVTMLLFWMGVAFELPLVMFTLAKVGVVNARQLRGLRKWALLLAFVVAALITPTPDPFNQTLVAVPIYMLFELGILLARIARPGS